MIRYIKYILAFTLFFASVSCKKFVEKGDVNINPNAASTTTLKSLLPALIDATATNYYYVAYHTSLFSQQMAAYTGGPSATDQNIDVRVDAMLGLYQNGMTNAKILMDLAVEQNAPYYGAIGKILMVANLSMATDLYGDVPFTNAFQAPQVLYPTYDKQQDLYPLMHKYLDEAITAASAAASGEVPGGDDFCYKGVMINWIQTARLFKARLFMHTTKKGTATAANSALTELAGAYPSSATDLQLVYNSRNKNPWTSNIALKVITGNLFITPSKRFVDAMNGNSYPGLIDPRLPLLMDKKTNATYSGLANGGGNTGSTIDLTTNTYYASDPSPLLMATYAEQKLIEAEARFLSNGGSATSTGSTQAAYDAYLAGIKAHMTKLGVSVANMNAYTANPQVATGPAGLKMEHIMREKQIVLYLNPESWVDVRRYDYSPAVFIGMALPLNQWVSMGGQFIRRSGLPNDELSRNPNATAANKLTTEKVWWDQ
ncbi:MAG: SusD/RagB family nutrient-binding outer membrane lipoprotein [Ferruginibacter sp.]